MSAFDDEFGLFSEETDESERRVTLGARSIAKGETIIDEIELDDESRRPRRNVGMDRGPRRRDRNDRHEGGERGRHTSGVDDVARQRRAGALIEFLTRRLVSKPDDVKVELFADETGQPIIEVVVDPEDLGKVIGRNGRVAQALRTLARASAEGRIVVDILDTDEVDEPGDSDVE